MSTERSRLGSLAISAHEDDEVAFATAIASPAAAAATPRTPPARPRRVRLRDSPSFEPAHDDHQRDHDESAHASEHPEPEPVRFSIRASRDVLDERGSRERPPGDEARDRGSGEQEPASARSRDSANQRSMTAPPATTPARESVRASASVATCEQPSGHAHGDAVPPRRRAAGLRTIAMSASKARRSSTRRPAGSARRDRPRGRETGRPGQERPGEHDPERQREDSSTEARGDPIRRRREQHPEHENAVNARPRLNASQLRSGPSTTRPWLRSSRSE